MFDERKFNRPQSELLGLSSSKLIVFTVWLDDKK